MAFFWYGVAMTKETKQPVGRPSKYNQQMQAKAVEYVYTWSEIKGNVIPSRVGLCCYLGIHKDTSYEWEKSHPEFSDTLKDVETLQEFVGLNQGVAGVFNPTITKLILANHGYSEKQEIDHRSGDGSMSPADHSKAVLEALKRKHSE
jgi:hypothetical protein